jgi:hypothetical protein
MFTHSAARAFSLDLSNGDVLTQLVIVHMHVHCVTEILHTIQHPSLQALHLECHRSTDADWEALCKVLDHSCFSFLGTLTVSYFNLDKDSVANARRNVTPLTSRAGFRFLPQNLSWGDA